jgi:hypothetical protein
MNRFFANLLVCVALVFPFQNFGAATIPATTQLMVVDKDNKEITFFKSLVPSTTISHLRNLIAAKMHKKSSAIILFDGSKTLLDPAMPISNLIGDVIEVRVEERDPQAEIKILPTHHAGAFAVEDSEGEHREVYMIPTQTIADLQKTLAHMIQRANTPAEEIELLSSDNKPLDPTTPMGSLNFKRTLYIISKRPGYHITFAEGKTKIKKSTRIMINDLPTKLNPGFSLDRFEALFYPAIPALEGQIIRSINITTSSSRELRPIKMSLNEKPTKLDDQETLRKHLNEYLQLPAGHQIKNIAFTAEPKHLSLDDIVSGMVDKPIAQLKDEAVTITINNTPSAFSNLSEEAVLEFITMLRKLIPALSGITIATVNIETSFNKESPKEEGPKKSLWSRIKSSKTKPPVITHPVSSLSIKLNDELLSLDVADIRDLTTLIQKFFPIPKITGHVLTGISITSTADRPSRDSGAKRSSPKREGTAPAGTPPEASGMI